MRKNILSGFLCLTLVFASCGQSMEERGESSGTLGESVPLNVEVSLSAEGVQSPSTRAPITEDDAEIGVFLTDQNGYTPQHDRKYSYDATAKTWSPASHPITVKTNPANVVAYYDPNKVVEFGKDGGIVNSTVTTSVLTAQNYDEKLLWYYDNTHKAVTSASPTIAFQMKPAYARLSFQISRNSSYPGAGIGSELAIKLVEGASSYISSATVDIADGSSTVKSTDTSIPAKEGSFDIPVKGSNNPDTGLDLVDLLLPPQPSFGMTLTLKVDGGEPLSVTIPASSFKGDNGTFVAGARYTVLVQISSAGVSSVSIPGTWDKGNEITGGIPGAPDPVSVP